MRTLRLLFNVYVDSSKPSSRDCEIKAACSHPSRPLVASYHGDFASGDRHALDAAQWPMVTGCIRGARRREVGTDWHGWGTVAY